MDLDIYYRALTDLRRHTKEDRDCEARRKSISSADTANDNIEVIKTNCIIEEDWIDAIEKGLVHVGKALGEERQFIRSNGEVIPIEKVKQVSKDSVEHLARHSNLLTRKPEEGRNIIPDQLYTVERLSDFAVYENRFLYMLLCFHATLSRSDTKKSSSLQTHITASSKCAKTCIRAAELPSVN